MVQREREPITVGERLVVEIGPIAHGGHCIAHARGRTLFVRHALPGEQVIVEVTEVTSKICRADAVEVLTASPDRVTPPCPLAVPAGCGGCDFQHVNIAAQRALKTQVLHDALRRFAGIEAGAPVEAVDGSDGLHWRTRVTWHATHRGRPGLYASRSHRVVGVDQCPIAHPSINAWLSTRPSIDASDVVTAVGDDGTLSVAAKDRVLDGPARVSHRVADRQWGIASHGFWQVHPRAARTLVDVVLEFANARAGEAWWDLYAGAGLFSAFLGEAVGAAGRVESVESSDAGARDARRALHDLPAVRLSTAPVATWLRTAPDGVDGVVLDPPRSGAGAAVVEQIVQHRPQRVIYVACDPVAFARDVASFRASGYELTKLRAFDVFPMTHHLEAVGLLTG